jgi:hypothetical protein
MTAWFKIWGLAHDNVPAGGLPGAGSHHRIADRDLDRRGAGVSPALRDDRHELASNDFFSSPMVSRIA